VKPRTFTRVAAYGICFRDDEVLLARALGSRHESAHWTLPGGGVEHGEDPYDAVVREVEEETGFRVAVERMVGVGTRLRHDSWGRPGGTDVHHVGIYYTVRIIGGSLRHEVGGSTDFAAWVPLAEVPNLRRAVLLETGLRLAAQAPADGHVPPIPVDGLLHY
jgi:ADP-ribose pyrophosphatase YjhB (NUDIX family)